MGLRDRLAVRRVQRELEPFLDEGVRVRATGELFMHPATVDNSSWQARRVAVPGVYRGSRSLLAPGRSLSGTLSLTDGALYVGYREDGMRGAATDLVRIDFDEIETLHWSQRPAQAPRNGVLTIAFPGCHLEAFVIMRTDPSWPDERRRSSQERRAA